MMVSPTSRSSSSTSAAGRRIIAACVRSPSPSPEPSPAPGDGCPVAVRICVASRPARCGPARSRGAGASSTFGNPVAIDPVGPIQHVLQHLPHVAGRGALPEQCLAHPLQTIGREHEGGGQRPGRQRPRTRQRQEDVFQMMRQGCDAAHTDRVARALQGVGQALRDVDVLQAAARGHALNRRAERLRMARHLLQEGVEQLRVHVTRHLEADILQTSLHSRASTRHPRCPA